MSGFGRKTWNFYLASHDPFGVPASPGVVLPPEQHLGNIDDADVSLKARKGSKWGGLAVGWAFVPWGIWTITIEPAGRAVIVAPTCPAVVSIFAQVGGRVFKATLDWEQLRSWQKSWSITVSLEVDAGRGHLS